MFEVLTLSTLVQVSLGIGYLAYSVAYAGFRRHHDTRDTVFITLVFAAVASTIFSSLLPWNPYLAGVLTLVIVLILGAAWRAFGRDAWLWVMSNTNVHREDGNNSTWEALVQTRKKVGQVSVHMKNGRVLYLNDRRKFVGAPWDGLYLGGDGSIVLAVEEEETETGEVEVREAVKSEWGTRLTYVPASEVARINIRLE